MEKRAAKIDGETEETLHIEYPSKEYKANVELADRYLGELLGKHMPEAVERTAFLSLQLMDGTRVGTHVPFVKTIVEAARAGCLTACRRPAKLSCRQAHREDHQTLPLAQG